MGHILQSVVADLPDLSQSIPIWNADRLRDIWVEAVPYLLFTLYNMGALLITRAHLNALFFSSSLALSFMRV